VEKEEEKKKPEHMDSGISRRSLIPFAHVSDSHVFTGEKNQSG